MSIDRCSRCGDFVDTDDEPEAYVQIADGRKREEWICLCREHREEWEGRHAIPDLEPEYGIRSGDPESTAWRKP